MHSPGAPSTGPPFVIGDSRDTNGHSRFAIERSADRITGRRSSKISLALPAEKCCCTCPLRQTSPPIKIRIISTILQVQSLSSALLPLNLPADDYDENHVHNGSNG